MTTEIRTKETTKDEYGVVDRLPVVPLVPGQRYAISQDGETVFGDYLLRARTKRDDVLLFQQVDNGLIPVDARDVPSKVQIELAAVAIRTEFDRLVEAIAFGYVKVPNAEQILDAAKLQVEVFDDKLDLEDPFTRAVLNNLGYRTQVD